MTSFLQSSEWEAFQQKLGRKTRRIDGHLVIRHTLPLGLNYLYVPRPDFKGEEGFKEFLSVADGAARAEKSIFLKVEPQTRIGVDHAAFRVSRGLQPGKTLVLALSKTENELLAAMHPKTRYNIRLAERKGVAAAGREKGGAEKFFAMLKDTAARDKFRVHAENHYQKLLGTVTGDFWNELFFAEYKGETLASAMVNFYKPSGTATYLHGASSRAHREVMAPHLLHWEIMREAKSRGFHWYDLRGIDEKRWPGVTRFKLGFGGKIIEYPPAIDIVYRPGWYGLYRIAKIIKQGETGLIANH